MGYEVTILDVKFTIKNELLGEVFNTIKDFAQHSPFGGVINVHQKHEILNADYLDDMLGNQFGWFPVYVKKNGQRGDIINFKYQWENDNEELSTYLFNIIAPFVEAGSYIEMCDDEANRWRYAFNGKVMKKLTPKITFKVMKKLTPTITFEEFK